MKLLTLILLCISLLPLAAVAQVGPGDQFICMVGGATPTIRGEGYTEQVGDITLTCSNGIAPAVGDAIPVVNITVFLNSAVTSRLLPVNSVSNNVSEALLTIDEPGSGLPPAVAGFGPAAPQNLCPTPLAGCVEYVSQKSGIAVATDTPQGTNATTPGRNVFQGVVSGNSVTFFGIPVLAAPGGTRIFRITNVRVNANPLGSGDGSLTPVVAALSISGATSMLISNATPLVGFVTGSLTASLNGPPACGGCNIANTVPAATLSFAEKFNSAFKSRVLAQNNIANAGQNGTPGSNGFAAQNVPGAVYNSESGLVLPAGPGQTAGLASFGTRLKAVFNNVPPGLRLFVSVANVDANGLPVTPPAVIGGSAANTGTTGFAQLTATETGDFSAVPSTGLGPGGLAPMAEIPVANGSATAIWEVINTNPHALENLRFVTYVYPGSVPSGAVTVNMSYAAVPPSFAPASGSLASAELPIPRFTSDPNSARTLLSANSANLSISKTHSGAFVQGQIGATYRLSVTNNALVSTDGSAVTVTDVLPSGMSATAIGGTGWSCTLGTLTCTRSEVLTAGASFPFITVTVNVAGNASSLLTNHATVSGGGSAAASADDLTTVLTPSGTAGLLGPNWIDVTCPGQATAGSLVTCSVRLRLGASTIVDSFAFSVAVTPNGAAPALNSAPMGFADSIGGGVKTTDGTDNAMSVSWVKTSSAVFVAQLGSLTFVLPASAVAGQSYTVTITSASASFYGAPVNITPGVPNTVTIPMPGQPTCTTNVTVTPNVREEGFTEEVGDITLTCIGGTAPELGAAVPQANITVLYNLPVTSRLLPQPGAANASEALLLIDEPGSGLPPTVPGFGPAAPQNLCTTPLTGCVEYVSQRSGIPVATDTAQGTSATTPGKNVFQGVVSGNSITFYGIPMLASQGNDARVFRITNVRVNANVLGSDVGISGAAPVMSSISVSGATTLGISNPTPYVAFVSPGLSTSAGTAPALSQCSSQNMTPAAALTFAEAFGTAFKTRVGAVNNTPYAGQSGTPAAQNIPGAIFNSESNFVLPVASGQTAGLTDSGTRLKAQFNNVPAGVRLFVSVANVQTNGLPVTAPPVIGGSAANTGTAGYAQLTSGETAAFSAVASTALAGSVPVVEIPVINGMATAVWEVINTNPNTNDTFRFGVYTSYTANPGQNSPTPGLATVNLSYAAAPPSFSAGAGAAASSALVIPRFAADTSSARNAFTITSCATLAPTATALTAAPAGGTNQYSLTATVTTTVTNVGIPAGTVTFYDNGVPLMGSTTTVGSAGTANFITVLPSGSHRLTAAFTPTNSLAFLPSTSPEVPISFGRSGTSMEIASSLYPSLAGQAVTFTATVTGAGAAPGGTVQFADGTQSLGSARLAGGRASVTATLTTVGVHDIFATYGGDGGNAEASARFGQRVDRVTDSLRLVSSAATAEFGQAVTLTATLSPQAPAGLAAATGTVQFQEGATAIGAAAMTAGAATLAISNLTAGTHTIFAVYSGDANWYGARSDAVTVTINAGATAMMLTSAATLTEVRLSAALTPAVSAGSVRFLDSTDSTVLGSVQPANGTATLAIAAEDAAKIAGHSVTAIYSGSGGFAGSMSNTMVLPALRNAAGGGSAEFAPDELVSLFGSKLADGAESAVAAELPQSLGGLRVNVTDAAGTVLAGGMSYVSASQVNFVMPAGLAPGMALVAVVRGGAVAAAMPVRVASVAPGLFASPQAVRTEGGDVYLVLYGTGIRNRSGNAGVTCVVNAAPLAVAYAGAQADFPGLDQVNVLLPAHVHGAVTVSVTVDGHSSNTVTASIQ
jgi:uncharacterized protein (TIGR03437 family)